MTYLLSVFVTASLLFTPTKSSKLEINIVGLESNSGKVLVLVFNESTGFPEDDSKAYKFLELSISNKTAKGSITDIPAGTYAISALHDEDGDGKMKKNGVGFPTESFGFSNDPSILFSAPSFEKCSFTVKEGTPKQISIKLK
ncbi:DUF2141 domain-containing protein [Algoriphagus sp.]|uniref:DUF2141 domain-containing protein n=1 Tax=Algoriphagus sp. TaxID=1872435 RepID=UPI00329A5B5F